MLDQGIVLALLQASVTGAGLVLTVYTLLLPIIGEVLETRARTLYDKLVEFKEESKEINAKVSYEKMENIKGIIDEIQAKKDIPGYLSLFVLVAFLGYTVSVIISLWWLLDFYKSIMNSWLPLVFGGATVIFIFSGYLTIRDVSAVIKEKFEEIKSVKDKSKYRLSKTEFNAMLAIINEFKKLNSK